MKIRMIARSVAIAPIRLYQISAAGRPSPCRFIPTCSTYAIEAIENRGVLIGLALTTRRLSRCHPFGRHGYDPVPG